MMRRLLTAAVGVAAAGIVLLCATGGLPASALGEPERTPVQGYGDALVNATELARRTKCQSNLHQVYAAIEEYRDREGRAPASLQALVDKKFLDKSMLRCPSSNSPAGSVDFVYDPAAQGDKPLCACRQPWHTSGRNVLKADGTVQWVKEK